MLFSVKSRVPTDLAVKRATVYRKQRARNKVGKRHLSIPDFVYMYVRVRGCARARIGRYDLFLIAT